MKHSKLVLVSLFVLLCSESCLCLRPGDGLLEAVFHQTDDAMDRRYKDKLSEVEIYIIVLLLPFMVLLFYNKVLESYVGDHHIKGMCERHQLDFPGFEHMVELIDVDSPIPTLSSSFSYTITLDKANRTQGIMIPSSLTPPEIRATHATGFAISFIHDNEDNLIEEGDILIAINCNSIMVGEKEDKMKVLRDKLENLGSSKWYEIRMPVILTLLRPTRGGDFCPNFAYHPKEANYCCLEADDECAETDRIPTTTQNRFIHSSSSRKLTDLWRESIGRSKPLQVTKPTATSPFVRSDIFSPRHHGYYGNRSFQKFKYLSFAFLVMFITILIVSVPLRFTDTPELKTILRAVIAFSVLLIVVAWAIAMVSARRHGFEDVLSKTNMLFVMVGVWFLVLLVPVVSFVEFRGSDGNRSSTQMLSFIFVASFLGVLFSTLYLVHALFGVLQTRWKLAVPTILSRHVSEVILGVGAFLESIAGFRDLSRVIYGGGSSCSIGDLKQELEKITRNGKKVRWACEANNGEGNDAHLRLGDGEGCNVICAQNFIKPVSCMDEGLIGGEWTLVIQNSTEKFCCHEFNCDPDTQVYNHSLCGFETDGCVNTTQL